MNNRLINTKVAGGGGCTDIVDNYDPFGGGGVALYQLNGNATDVSGNYNGSATNVTYGTGVFGQAGVFNGSSSKIVANGISINTANEWSISFWFKPNLDNTWQRIIGLGVQGIELIVQKRGDNNKARLLARNEGNQIDFDGSVLTNGQWYNIVVTGDGITAKMYINNSTSFSSAIGTKTTYSNLYIGNGNLNSTEFVNGSIDQVRIFNTALDPLEVEALYTEELCICDGTVDTLDILGDGSCIATYQLDGNANDLSGNYSGTPTDVSYGVGEFDLAGVFNGSSSQIEIAATSTTPVDVSQSNYSISLWVKTTSTSSQRLISKYANDDAVAPFFLANNADGTLSFAERGGSGGTVVEITTTTLTVNNGNWRHVVVTKSPTATTIYIDNSAFVNNNTHTQVNGGTTPWRIGRDNPSSPSYFTGSIDQVRIFNKALNSTEVTTLYNETACTKAACSGTTNTLDILGDGSCIAAYPLDGSPADLSGNYNGVQTDVTYPQGYFDLAGSFNGSSSYIKANGAVTSAGAFSASFWFNFNSLGSYSPVIVANTLSGSNGGFQVRINYVNGKIEFFPEGGGQGTLLSDVAPAFNTWYHVVGTFDGSTFKLYVNDSLQTNTLSGTLTANPPNDLYIGTNPSILTRVLDGQIDQVRIFNKALSAGEVTTLYNETSCN